nr:hypothetical protein CFP56_42221 [Quercus suber]
MLDDCGYYSSYLGDVPAIFYRGRCLTLTIGPEYLLSSNQRKELLPMIVRLGRGTADYALHGSILDGICCASL